MAEDLQIADSNSREEKYKVLLPQVRSVISHESDFVANLANVAAMLAETFSFFWVGFYREIDGELVLGPFQGPLACTRIPFGRGVCGVSAEKKESILVPDVEKFPGHIACSSLSKSEIVVPLVVNDETKLILDVDSDKLNDFGEVDRRCLEEVMQIIKERHY